MNSKNPTLILSFSCFVMPLCFFFNYKRVRVYMENSSNFKDRTLDFFFNHFFNINIFLSPGWGLEKMSKMEEIVWYSQLDLPCIP